MYVVSSEDGSSHMVAITASFFEGGYEDGLRLFGMTNKEKEDLYIFLFARIGDSNRNLKVPVIHQIH